MKRLYSIILLFSFLIGTLQPILPMVEYQLHEGDIMELLDHSQDETGKLSSVVTFSSTDQTPTHSSDHDHSLLNDNFYPLGIDISTLSQLVVFPNTKRFFLPIVRNISSPSFLPNPPPPRLS